MIFARVKRKPNQLPLHHCSLDDPDSSEAIYTVFLSSAVSLKTPLSASHLPPALISDLLAECGDSS